MVDESVEIISFCLTEQDPKRLFLPFERFLFDPVMPLALQYLSRVFHVGNDVCIDGTAESKSSTEHGHQGL